MSRPTRSLGDDYDRSKSPITCVFGTLSVRPSVEGLTQYRYFRYPNGEEHVYDLVNDPGETENIAATAPLGSPCHSNRPGSRPFAQLLSTSISMPPTKLAIRL